MCIVHLLGFARSTNWLYYPVFAHLQCSCSFITSFTKCCNCTELLFLLQLEHELDFTTPQINNLQKEIETLKREKAKNQQAEKEKVIKIYFKIDRLF